MRISDSCPCGAQFNAHAWTTDSFVSRAYQLWLTRHSSCKPGDQPPKLDTSQDET